MKCFVMKQELEREYTYVMFGSEAISLYKMSISILLASSYVEYKIGAYVDVKQFVQETLKWDSFIEISESDFKRIRKHSFKSPLSKITVEGKRRRRTFFDFFLK